MIVGRLAAEGCAVAVAELGPGLVGLTAEPGVGIGPTGKLGLTDGGNVLLDGPGYVDHATVEALEGARGILAIGASHPHMYGAQSPYSRAFGDAPILVAHGRRVPPAAGAGGPAVGGGARGGPGPVARAGRRALPGQHRRAPPRPGPTGADGRGVLLAGDAIFPGPQGYSVSFLRRYPNRIPLSGAVVRRIADQVGRLEFDRPYNNFRGLVPERAGEVVQEPARRYVERVTGVHDDPT